MKIKICGITNLADAGRAIGCGADMLGFVFYPKSPRYIEPEAAAAITAEVPPTIELVGVFVNEPVERLIEVGRCARLTTLQLHGNEPPELLPELLDFRVIKALSITSEDDLSRLSQYPGAQMLVDTPCEEWGGSGKTGDWALARKAAAIEPILLAGGLTPENVADAVRRVQPFGIDASSGVELTKGRKDHEKVQRLIENARKAGTESSVV